MFKLIPTAVFLIHLLLAVQCAPLGRRQFPASLSPGACLDKCRGVLYTYASNLALDAQADFEGFASTIPGSEGDVNYLFERSGKAQSSRDRGSARYQPYTSRPHASGSGGGSQNSPRPPRHAAPAPNHPGPAAHHPPAPNHPNHPGPAPAAQGPHHIQPSHIDIINAQRGDKKPLTAHDVLAHWPHPESRGQNDEKKGHLAFVTKQMMNNKIWTGKTGQFSQARFNDQAHLVDHMRTAHTTGTAVGIQGTAGHDPLAEGPRTMWRYTHPDHANHDKNDPSLPHKHLGIQADPHTGEIFGVQVQSHAQVQSQQKIMEQHGYGVHPVTGAAQDHGAPANTPSTSSTPSTSTGGSLLSRLGPPPGTSLLDRLGPAPGAS